MADPRQIRERCSAEWGVLAAFVVGVVYLPFSLVIQHMVNVPRPAPVPQVAFLSGLDKGATSYWLSWATSLIVCVLPGVVLIPFRRYRRFGVGFTLTAIIICGLAGTAFLAMEIEGGIIPDG